MNFDKSRIACLISIFFALSLVFSACKDSGGDDGAGGTTGTTGTTLADTSGTATVDTITDPTDFMELQIKSYFPADGSAGIDVNTPIVLFMDDKILKPTLTGNYSLTADGVTKNLSLSIAADAQGHAILIFKPTESLPPGASITFYLSQLVKDDGGQPLDYDFTIDFTTATTATSTPFNSNGSFESGSSGVSFLGDGAILSGAQGDVSPASGSAFAVITTGENLVSTGVAINDTTSMLVAGPVTTSFSKLSFKADFASSEFNDYVDSEFDDTALVIVYGPSGVKAFTITSVNLAGENGNTKVTGFAGLPDGGDDWAGHTGWKDYSVTGISVGTPAFVVFVVSDVGDDALSSALAVDVVSFQ